MPWTDIAILCAFLAAFGTWASRLPMGNTRRAIFIARAMIARPWIRMLERSVNWPPETQPSKRMKTAASGTRRLFSVFSRRAIRRILDRDDCENRVVVLIAQGEILALC